MIGTKFENTRGRLESFTCDMDVSNQVYLQVDGRPACPAGHGLQCEGVCVFSSAKLINRIGPHLTLYDRLSSNSLTTLERVLLYLLSHEPSALVQHKAVNTIADVANKGMTRGHMWHVLQAQALAIVQGKLQGMLDPSSASSSAVVPRLQLHSSAFLIFAASPALITNLQMDAILCKSYFAVW
ncbi:hypothetical protein FISHEDRAFT_75014 [Fistulina hepatica ATCC 64428]|uniref:Uncharacterized protein n=1 Tax=Fistulina hepatica ATCC 64428 TaxID=1128425 RepID=A0A0D7A8H4_9AGAR|nr:hypothetical protein FISHEDRAFT_75014 [Fistulina hepatica ATCC 64428]